jgi:hypothetical protein
MWPFPDFSSLAGTWTLGEPACFMTTDPNSTSGDLGGRAVQRGLSRDCKLNVVVGW